MLGLKIDRSVEKLLTPVLDRSSHKRMRDHKASNPPIPPTPLEEIAGRTPSICQGIGLSMWMMAVWGKRTTLSQTDAMDTTIHQ